MLDELAVEQIADNLLSNAVKYGAGEPIEVALVGDGSKARLTVRDHGIGISEQDQVRPKAASRMLAQPIMPCRCVTLWPKRRVRSLC
jgi:light-regulated signal transduction histidine kinase (bacteriophytochrome)